MQALPKGLMGGDSFAGIITVNNWTMARDGETYLYFWAPKWVVLTDKTIGGFVGQKDFRSSEKWSLIGYSSPGEDPMMFFPGCQVKGWCHSSAAPQTSPGAGAIYTL